MYELFLQPLHSNATIIVWSSSNNDYFVSWPFVIVTSQSNCFADWLVVNTFQVKLFFVLLIIMNYPMGVVCKRTINVKDCYFHVLNLYVCYSWLPIALFAEFCLATLGALVPEVITASSAPTSITTYWSSTLRHRHHLQNLLLIVLAFVLVLVRLG